MIDVPQWLSDADVSSDENETGDSEPQFPGGMPGSIFHGARNISISGGSLSAIGGDQINGPQVNIHIDQVSIARNIDCSGEYQYRPFNRKIHTFAFPSQKK